MSSTIRLTMDQPGAVHELLLRTPPGQHSMAGIFTTLHEAIAVVRDKGLRYT